VDPEVLGLNVLVNRSQPGGSWTTNGSPPVSFADNKLNRGLLFRCMQCTGRRLQRRLR